MKRIVASIIALVLLCGIFHVVSFADANHMFNPEKTNIFYNDMIQGLKKNGTYDSLKRIENFHDSHIWANEGWTRALLVTLLSSDLNENDEKTYNEFVGKMKECYVAAIPNFLGEGFVYYVIIKNNSDALTLTYTPGSTATGYDVIENYKSEEYNNNLKALGGIVWPVTDDDFVEMMDTGIFG